MFTNKEQELINRYLEDRNEAIQRYREQVELARLDCEKQLARLRDEYTREDSGWPVLYQRWQIFYEAEQEKRKAETLTISASDSMHAPDIGLRRDADGEWYEVETP